jgi:uncharacterized membrane protein YdjX (TVP38/TMEM64 family)
MARGSRRTWLAIAVVASVAFVGVLALSPQRVLRSVAALATRPVLFAVVLAALYLGRWLVFWPVTALSLLVGYVYGIRVGIPVALVGATITALPPFLFTRYATHDLGVLDRVQDRAAELSDATGAFRGIFAARLIPLPAEAVSCAAGLSEISIGAYLLGTAAGETPWVIAAVVAGSSMRTFALSSASPDLRLVVGLAALGVLVLAGPLYRQLGDGPATTRF